MSRHGCLPLTYIVCQIGPWLAFNVSLKKYSQSTPAVQTSRCYEQGLKSRWIRIENPASTDFLSYYGHQIVVPK